MSHKEVQEIPANPQIGSTFIINAKGISSFTHGIFKYPCKFIPHIPRWFLTSYGNSKTREYGVLDPFVGSGTTLIESSLLSMPSYGIDIDPLSKLITKVKSTPFSEKEIVELKLINNEYTKKLKTDLSEKSYSRFTPKFPNLDYWFPKESIKALATIKYFNSHFYKKTGSEKINDFLAITLASIIRKASLADEQSPKPYISRKIKKTLPDIKTLFLDYLSKYSNAIIGFSETAKVPLAKVIGYDAREVDKKSLAMGKVHLAMTSPPYINAFDYVRSLRLENIWLDLLSEQEIQNLYIKHIGTEKISAEKYKKEKPSMGINALDLKLSKIYGLDKKRAYVVADFFKAMSENLKEVYGTLIKGGYYCIVVGDSKIKNITIPTSRYLIELAEKEGFILDNDFSYVIRNRYLRIPRMGRGGFIPKDYILVFKK